MGTESWSNKSWWNSLKGAPENGKALIGDLVFEVAGLMSKVTNFWHFLSEKEISRLKKEIFRSPGIRKLVADSNHHLMDLALNEIMENFRLLSISVARLARRCVDPPFCHFEHFVNDPLNSAKWNGLDYRLKKMERKVRKMERFVAVTVQLSQEITVLAELEQTLRRMKANPNVSRAKLLDFQQKVVWHRHEVKNLKETSPWIRTYDYTIRLLVRSLLTILQKIKYAFDGKLISTDGNGYFHVSPTLNRSRTISAFTQSSIHPSANIFCGISSGPLGKSSSAVVDKNKTNNKQQNSKNSRLNQSGPFKECMMSGIECPVLGSFKPNVYSNCTKNVDIPESMEVKSPTYNNIICSILALFGSKHGFLEAPPSTLGYNALALHYANVIVLIEKLAPSLHMIDYETRDDLYNMLPTNIRAALRTRLKDYGKSLGSSAYDASLAEEWSLAVTRILKWLSPLAHNMIRWHSERSFEGEQEVSRTNVLLVQTLHYANQEKTEAAITELLVGLSHICRINGYFNEKPQEIYSGLVTVLKMDKNI